MVSFQGAMTFKPSGNFDSSNRLFLFLGGRTEHGHNFPCLPYVQCAHILNNVDLNRARYCLSSAQSLAANLNLVRSIYLSLYYSTPECSNRLCQHIKVSCGFRSQMGKFISPLLESVQCLPIVS